MSTEQNKDKTSVAVKKPATSRFAEAQKRAEKLAAGSGSNGPSENAAVEFFKGAWSELKKTTWPTKEVLTKSVTVVLMLVFAVAVAVLAVDFVARRLLDPIFGVSSS